MAKIEETVFGDFDMILDTLETAVMEGSMSASCEDGSDYQSGNFRCSVRVYERYSYSGGNRVSMALVLAGADREYHLTAITSGGSQGMFFKINTWGEENFLDTIQEAVNSLT